jgi:hypothetical protein
LKPIQQQLACFHDQLHKFQNIDHKKPSRNKNNEVWFNLPGQASTFIPNEGTAQLCNTSAAVINRRICVLKGKTTLLSTSNKRSSPISNSSSGII